MTEIHKRLIYSFGANNVDDIAHIRSALFDLKEKNYIKKQAEYWSLSTATSNISSLRKKRMRLSELKLKELEPFLHFAQSIHWIKGVAVTGSVSVRNAEAKDDVDLMIIVQRQRLWLVRPVLVLFSFLRGKRRSWNHEEYNSWCLNLWLEEDALQVRPERRVIYTAYEVCQAEWHLSREGLEHRFLSANSWVAGLLPNFYAMKLSAAKRTSAKKSSNLFIFSGFFDVLNTLAYTIQLWYMRPHMTREKVSSTAAFFHPRDTRKMIGEEWKTAIKKLADSL